MINPRAILALLLLLPFLPACGVANEPLMPTPVLYTDGALDPFAHLDDTQRTTTERVFFATDREPLHERADDPRYGNTTTGHLHLGEATVRFGQPDLTWNDLHAASTAERRDEEIHLHLDTSRHHARFKPTPGEKLLDVHEEAATQWFDAIDAQLARGADREILIYVHGAKVNFENACVVTAELDHFSGRDFVGVAFSWPVHQTILTYLSGEDVERAYHSAHSLRHLIEILADHTSAERINILGYSAGAKVAIRALAELRDASPDLDEAGVQARWRVGRVIFAAPDVDLEVLVEKLPSVHDMAIDGVAVTVTDHDAALEMGQALMGGHVRAGELAVLDDPRVRDELERLPRLEFINVSAAKSARGFDIAGHHYWHAHPWAASDIIMLLRTALAPHERGLTPTDTPRVWQLPPGYPDRVRDSARRALGSTW